ncbi:MAG: hypothetical protein JWL61_41 [Gemmatimonadetes bacterium]|nr:hypothetical protein [Gemmatimonadota bacterium]
MRAPVAFLRVRRNGSRTPIVGGRSYAFGGGGSGAVWNDCSATRSAIGMSRDAWTYATMRVADAAAMLTVQPDIASQHRCGACWAGD